MSAPAAPTELARLSLFEDCDPGPLAQLASMLTWVRAAPGEVLARQDEVAQSFLLLATGTARVLRDDGDGEGEREVATVGGGSIVGELSVLRAAPRSATVVATSAVTGYAGDAGAFAALLDLPGVAPRVARTARQRLAANTRPVATRSKDGTRVLIRPVLPTDEDKLADAAPRFSRESHYRRFFSAPPLGDRIIRYLIDVDYRDHFAWTVLAPDEPGEPGVASGRCIRERADPEIAEVACSVIDEYQGRGVGTLVMGALGIAAREIGIRRFRAHVLAENEPMRAILKRSGAHFGFGERGVLETVMDLPPFGAGLPDRETADALRDATRDVIVAADVALGVG